jgi:hypothetical protein
MNRAELLCAHEKSNHRFGFADAADGTSGVGTNSLIHWKLERRGKTAAVRFAFHRGLGPIALIPSRRSPQPTHAFRGHPIPRKPAQPTAAIPHPQARTDGPERPLSRPSIPRNVEIRAPGPPRINRRLDRVWHRSSRGRQRPRNRRCHGRRRGDRSRNRRGHGRRHALRNPRPLLIFENSSRRGTAAL